MEFHPSNLARASALGIHALLTSLWNRVGRVVAMGWIAAACLAGASPAHADALQNWSMTYEGPPWVTNHTAFNAAHYDVAFGKGLFVAVGYDYGDFGSIYTSPDGRNWTARHTNQADTIYGELVRVIYANGRFMTVGWFSAYISDDGMTWVRSNARITFTDVCFGQGKYLMIAQSGEVRIAGSSGNISGRTINLPMPARRIGYGNGRFVILCYQNDSFTPIFWSDNTVDWFMTQAPPYGMSGLAWGNGLFVSLGRSGGPAYLPVILTSPDGIAWTAREAGVTNLVSSVNYINGLFIATGDSVILTSTNGINWDSRTTTNQISRIAYGNGTLVGISGRGKDLSQSAPLLQLQIDREAPSTVNVSGVVGRTIQMEAAAEAAGPWRPLDQFLLPTSPYSWTDPASPALSNQLYRAVWLP